MADERPSSQPSITCPRCGRTSYHPQDIAQGYCGSCHWWTSDAQLGPYADEVCGGSAE